MCKRNFIQQLVGRHDHLYRPLQGKHHSKTPLILPSKTPLIFFWVHLYKAHIPTSSFNVSIHETPYMKCPVQLTSNRVSHMFHGENERGYTGQGSILIPSAVLRVHRVTSARPLSYWSNVPVYTNYRTTAETTCLTYPFIDILSCTSIGRCPNTMFLQTNMYSMKTIWALLYKLTSGETLKATTLVTVIIRP